MEDKEILTEVTKYLDYLETPSDNFGGMPVCPFLKKERVTENLMLGIWRPDEKSFFELLDKFVESDNTSALLVCMDTDGIMWEEIGRNKYQKAIQLAMEEKGYKKHKALCFSPYEDWTAAGESTRKKAPYFLINGATAFPTLRAANRAAGTKGNAIFILLRNILRYVTFL